MVSRGVPRLWEKFGQFGSLAKLRIPMEVGHFDRNTQETCSAAFCLLLHDPNRLGTGRNHDGGICASRPVDMHFFDLTAWS